MDLASSKYFQSPPFFTSNGELKMVDDDKNPFADTFPDDPLCKLNLDETSEFAKGFPMAASSNNNIITVCSRDGVGGGGGGAVSVQGRRGVNSATEQRRVFVAPGTPGRPVFSFNGGGGDNFGRKSFSSKWDNAEKWLISSPAHGAAAIKSSPGHHQSSSKMTKQCDDNFKQQTEIFADKSKVTEEKVAKFFTGFKDKFTDEIEPISPNFRYSEPSREGFIFRNSVSHHTMKDAGTEVAVFHGTVITTNHKDVGTETSPVGSRTTSRSHTPLKTSSSPARHNTPTYRSSSGVPLASASASAISQLLQLGTTKNDGSNWSSREEEEEEVSKSLRHFEYSTAAAAAAARRSVSEYSGGVAWDEEEESTKCCLRYHREEAKIQAWVNLQSAKAEAESRKLEVKIQKMRSNLEEKLMKRMAVVHRKAEEWRSAAKQEHGEQMQRAKKIMNRSNSHNISGHNSFGCFPCNKII